MEISNGNNFYLIEKNTIFIWGLNIPSKKIEISNKLRNFIVKNELSFNEVCEFNQREDYSLFSLIYKIPLNELH